MTMRLGPLFADRPVGDAGEPIWRDRPLRRQLEQIAGTLVAPLVTGVPSPSLTVGVRGPWGSGKSTALCVLRDLALAEVKRLAPGGTGDAPRIVFCEYSAPLWQTSKLEPRTTLVASMLTSLAGSAAQAVEDLFLPAKAVSAGVASAAQPRDEEGRAAWSAAALEQIALVLPRLQGFDAMLGRRILGEGEAAQRVLAVLIDDLDRCEPAFVFDILSELHRLGAVRNLFFIVAGAEETLRRAVRDGSPGRARPEADTERELAKLVQHVVDIPPLDEAGARALLARLFPDPDDLLGKVLIESADLVLAGIAEPTPRAVKRSLNAFGDRLLEELSRPGFMPMDGRKVLKRALLRATWPDFDRACFEPMSRSAAARDREPLLWLQGIFQRAALFGGSDRRVRHELMFLCDEFPFLAWRELPLPLVRFLGTHPPLVDDMVAPEGKARPPRAAQVKPSATAGESAYESLPDIAPTEADLFARARGALEALPADDPSARLDRACELVLDLMPLEPDSDAAAMALASALLPAAVVAGAPHAAPVLSRHVTLLRRHGLSRAAGRELCALYDGAAQVPFVRDAYAAYLIGAGAVEAARRVQAGEAVMHHDLLMDEPGAEDLLRADAEVEGVLGLVLPGRAAV